MNKRESRTLRVKSNVRPPTIKITNCSDGQEPSKGRDQSHFTLPGFIHPFIHSFQGPPCSVDMNYKANRLLLHLKCFQFCEEDGSNKKKFFEILTLSTLDVVWGKTKIKRKVYLVIYKTVHVCVLSDSVQPYGHNLSSSLVHGILQARILEWVGRPFSRGSSRPRDWSRISSTSRRVLYH